MRNSIPFEVEMPQTGFIDRLEIRSDLRRIEGRWTNAGDMKRKASRFSQQQNFLPFIQGFVCFLNCRPCRHVYSLKISTEFKIGRASCRERVEMLVGGGR